MNTSIQRLLRRPRAWGLVASCVLVLSAPCHALAQTSNSNAGANQPSATTQPPGNAPFTFVQQSKDKSSARRSDSGKNEK